MGKQQERAGKRPLLLFVSYYLKRNLKKKRKVWKKLLTNGEVSGILAKLFDGDEVNESGA